VYSGKAAMQLMGDWDVSQMLGLTKLEGQYAINVPAVMAAVLLSVLPLVVLFAVIRKQVVRSLGSVVMR
jgi:ABC-type glycerol-3-phosphate transport system permease component